MDTMQQQNQQTECVPGTPTAVYQKPQCAPLPQQRVAELTRLERQMIPVLNSIRKELGKRPVIVPKE